jgi:hypothetical protein
MQLRWRRLRPCVRYTLVNPGGEHLDTGHYPLPRLFMSLMLAWLFLTSAQYGQGRTIHTVHCTTASRRRLEDTAGG